MPDRVEDGPALRAEDIAVIGVHGRFPGARDCDELWSRLRAGDDCVTTLSEEELRAAGTPDALLSDPAYVRTGGGLSDVFGFDHEFFGYSAREAELMDPQQRLFLEAGWELLETIGFAGATPQRSIGVFAGASMNTYLPNVLAREVDLLSLAGTEIMLGNDKDYLPMRLSYKLGLTGPSVNVQSGCSTSLVAIHTAGQSLLNGECDIALAGGVSVHVGPHPGYKYQDGLMFSPDGRCRPFDAAASGTAFGDGLGVVALKRLAEAVADGDRILAVVKGSAVNNDGAGKIGFTAPSIDGQREVITEAHVVAEVSADDISYLEAHGTGTVLGDPVEFAALHESFAEGTDRRGFCVLGSVKANVGHLAGAAGVTGFIKTVLALHHGEIPPHPHFDRPNPELDLAASPFRINTEPLPWPAGDLPRRAGVSSFGMGGTNAHVVLEEAPQELPAVPETAGRRLVAVSAASPRALTEALGALADRLDHDPRLDLADVAFTLRVGRREFPYRRAVVADGPREAAQELRRAARSADLPPVEFAPDVALLLGPAAAAGFGAVAEDAPVLRDALSLVEEELVAIGVAPATAADIVTAALEGRAASPPAGPTAFVAAHALAELWTRSGVTPTVLVGTGVGELSAACLAGILTLREALAVVAWDAGLLSTAPVLTPRAGSVPVYSADTARPLRAEEIAEVQRWRERFGGAADLTAALSAAVAPETLLLAVGATATAAPGAVVPCPASGERGATEFGVLDAGALLWTAGVPVDWTGWRPGRRRRVPLPTHPFHRRRHVARPTPAAEAPTATAPAAAEEPARRARPADWLFAESWHRLPLGGPFGGSVDTRPWLLLSDEGGLGQALRAELARHGVPSVTARIGTGFARVGAASFTVDPKDPTGMWDLFAALAEDGSLPGTVVHLWSLDDGTGLEPDDVENARQRGFDTLVELAGELARRSPAGSGARIQVVARGLFDVLGGETVSPATSTVLGAAAVIPQEFPRLTARCLDPGDDPLPAERLLAELDGPSDEPVLAFRRGRRWARRFEHTAGDGATAPSALRPGGTYLITGGLGGIGLTLAEHLASTVGARLVLTGRSAFPEPAEYDAWLREHGPDHPAGRRVARVRDLAERTEVLAASVDVTDERAMADLVAEASRRFGRIDGWFHAAGVPLDRAVRWIGRSDRQAWREVMAPKVDGALVLERVFADRPVDFGCLVSSLSSLVGGLGYAGYAAANAFLDAMASARPDRLTVNWEGWDLPGQQPITDGASESWQELRRLALTPEEGAAAFDMVLRQVGERRLAVSTSDLDARIRRWAAGSPPPAGETPAPGSVPEPVPGSLGEDLEQRLARVWGEVLHCEVDQFDKSVFDLGGNSLLLVELALRIEESLGFPLQATDLLEAPTIAHLADRLRANAGETPDDELAKAAQRVDRRARARASRRTRKGLTSE
ncbi:SDR family NAD(P)-dependent oxidoreductase [Streptomyces sp. NBC_01618]|uniref:type I polyketide synthase n=1 Tax=Streptomyces sp. NBC_01618 TaxID=2975900 RepID=UPI00386709E3|nr:SDR family NAD(P)-dependent oxidoreductase [Streptomyces sp. NBC_01618]